MFPYSSADTSCWGIVIQEGIVTPRRSARIEDLHSPGRKGAVEKSDEHELFSRVLRVSRRQTGMDMQGSRSSTFMDEDTSLPIPGNLGGKGMSKAEVVSEGPSVGYVDAHLAKTPCDSVVGTSTRP